MTLIRYESQKKGPYDKFTFYDDQYETIKREVVKFNNTLVLPVTLIEPLLVKLIGQNNLDGQVQKQTGGVYHAEINSADLPATTLNHLNRVNNSDYELYEIGIDINNRKLGCWMRKTNEDPSLKSFAQHNAEIPGGYHACILYQDSVYFLNQKAKGISLINPNAACYKTVLEKLKTCHNPIMATPQELVAICKMTKAKIPGIVNGETNKGNIEIKYRNRMAHQQQLVYNIHVVCKNLNNVNKVDAFFSEMLQSLVAGVLNKSMILDNLIKLDFQNYNKSGFKLALNQETKTTYDAVLANHLAREQMKNLMAMNANVFFKPNEVVEADKAKDENLTNMPLCPQIPQGY